MAFLPTFASTFTLLLVILSHFCLIQSNPFWKKLIVTSFFSGIAFTLSVTVVISVITPSALVFICIGVPLILTIPVLTPSALVVTLSRLPIISPSALIIWFLVFI